MLIPIRSPNLLNLLIFQSKLPIFPKIIKIFFIPKSLWSLILNLIPKIRKRFLKIKIYLIRVILFLFLNLYRFNFDNINLNNIFFFRFLRLILIILTQFLLIQNRIRSLLTINLLKNRIIIFLMILMSFRIFLL